MLRVRLIPTLLLRQGSLVKTTQFGKFVYIGDPCNTVRIFNELEVDELVFLDITATKENREPDLGLLKDIASECFMPLAYGGGIQSVEMATSILQIGYEKIIINSHLVANPRLIRELSNQFGSQAVIASIDVKSNRWHQYRVYTHNGRKKVKMHPVDWAKHLEEQGAGEILLTAIDREGTWQGFDLNLVKMVTDEVSIPVIAHGGCRSLSDCARVVFEANASAVAMGSMVVFQKKHRGVLINFPHPEEINQFNLSADVIRSHKTAVNISDIG